MIWRHVLRNALLPTITVIATQTGYLIGGLVVIETLFHYQGIGALIFTAAQQEGLPDPAGRRARPSGSSITLATLIADLLYAAAQPAYSARGRRMTTIEPPAPSPCPQPKAAAGRAPCRLRLLVRSPTFLSASRSSLFWVVCALFGEHVVPYDPFADDLLNALDAALGASTGSAPTSSAAMCSRASSSARATS